MNTDNIEPKRSRLPKRIIDIISITLFALSFVILLRTLIESPQHNIKPDIKALNGISIVDSATINQIHIANLNNTRILKILQDSSIKMDGTIRLKIYQLLQNQKYFAEKLDALRQASTQQNLKR